MKKKAIRASPLLRLLLFCHKYVAILFGLDAQDAQRLADKQFMEHMIHTVKGFHTLLNHSVTHRLNSTLWSVKGGISRFISSDYFIKCLKLFNSVLLVKHAMTLFVFVALRLSFLSAKTHSMGGAVVECSFPSNKNKQDCVSSLVPAFPDRMGIEETHRGQSVYGTILCCRI